MLNKTLLLTQTEIENRIFTVRGVQVMLDSHLAEIFGIENKRLNEQVKRNVERFPEAFRFQLTEDEWNILKSQIATSSAGSFNQNNDPFNTAQNLRLQNVTSRLQHGGRRYLPFAFTEQGVAMLSAVLKSESAIKVSIQVINAFVEMRKIILSNALLFQRLDKVESRQIEADHKFEQIFKALESKEPKPENGIFYEGQVFDAYVFVAGLIKKAQVDIILIDNYTDETVLTLLAKRNSGVSATIYTGQVTKQLQLDLIKHNSQYPAITLKTITGTHDRFLLIDQKELYHLGASLKDLGKKWFAFSRMNDFAKEILKRIHYKND